MRHYWFILLLLVPAVSFAAEPSSGWSAISDTVHSIGQFFTELPAMISRAITYAARASILFYFKVKLSTLEFCFDMASSVISSFNVTATIQGYVSRLPGKIQYCVNELGFVNGISFLLNCWGTRFILNLIGW
jgi:hypothetical protein